MSWTQVTEKDFSAGVRIETVAPGQAGQRLDNFLSGSLTGAPRSLIYKIIRTGQVRVNGGRCKPTTRLETGDQVRIPPVRVAGKGPVSVPDWALEKVAQAVLYEDDDILALDKPVGMAVHGGSGLAWGLVDVIRQLRPGSEMELVHRLDRETSGCLLVAKNKASMRQLQAQFRENRPDKRYLCLLDGMLQQDHCEVDQPLLQIERGGERMTVVDERGKPARTRFRVLERRRLATFAEAALLTGRTHQIRAHAAHLGAPLAGDERYAGADATALWRERGLRRLFLHAHFIEVERRDGQSLQVSSPLPDELREILSAC